jgi:hypothetical protein
LGFKIDSPEYGWIIDSAYHLAEGNGRQLHPKWNQAWQNFFDNCGRRGFPATATEVQGQLDRMMKDFGWVLKNGKQATMSYKEWNDWIDQLRKAAASVRETGGMKVVRIVSRGAKITTVVVLIFTLTSDGVAVAAEDARGKKGTGPFSSHPFHGRIMVSPRRAPGTNGPVPFTFSYRVNERRLGTW